MEFQKYSDVPIQHCMLIQPWFIYSIHYRIGLLVSRFYEEKCSPDMGLCKDLSPCNLVGYEIVDFLICHHCNIKLKVFVAQLLTANSLDW